MSLSITANATATTLVPSLVLGYKSERKTGNIVHPIIGRGNPDITFGPATLRTGTLRIFCLGWAEALAMENLHLNSGTFTFTDTVTTSASMTYVPSGAIASEVDEQGWTRWIVSVDYQEVS